MTELLFDAADGPQGGHILSRGQIFWAKFTRHRVATVSLVFIVLLYVVVLVAEFVTPYDPFNRHVGYLLAPPTGLQFVDTDGQFHLQPFVYGLKNELNRETFQREYVVDTSKRYPLALFVKGDAYQLFGVIPTDVHLFGVEGDGKVFLAGTDTLGRDLFTRMIFGARTSLFVGLFGLSIGFALGLFFGGISGYFGGTVDNLVQRLTEFLQSLPTLPLWMALAALVPQDWTPTQVYFGISTVLAVVGWTTLARVVRGKLLSLREEDYVMAAKVSGVSEARIILTHLLPGFTSYLIVYLTLAIPQMILGEVALSFLGLGLRPPAVSLGTLLIDSQNIQTVTLSPWLLVPGGLVVLIVVAFSFLGDGLRDAVDPYRT
ncbi:MULTISPECIES: ABC transporter permease [unclassified Devosia]|uniref:ABC transporter permease n=1 Tax=unclassified Devosia TaxID=196773 RepID=UPI000AA0F4C7|nr:MULTISPECIES: ABC transporter permease [unclassified Devosia]